MKLFRRARREKGYIIIHQCQKCGGASNKAAHDAKVQPDDINLIIKLTVARI